MKQHLSHKEPLTSGQSQLASAVLMVRPASFGFNPETAFSNAYQKAPQADAATIENKALQEFDQYVDTLKAQGIEVLVIQDSKEPAKPDAVFPNNWFCTLPARQVIIFPMLAPSRREEKRDEILAEIQAHYDVMDFEDWSEYEAENFFLEGTGSMIFDHPNRTIYACLSERTHKSLLETFAKAHSYRPVYFTATDGDGKAIYHTNVMMHIGATYAVICLESIKNQAERIRISQELTSSGHEIIDISLEQVKAFAGNMLQVQNSAGIPYTLMSESSYQSLSAEQKHILEIHSNLLPVKIPTIESVGGGSARCMVAELFLPKKAFTSFQP
jgi:hypothetical protein